MLLLEFRDVILTLRSRSGEVPNKNTAPLQLPVISKSRESIT
jgi:hypothetical protein